MTKKPLKFQYRVSFQVFVQDEKTRLNILYPFLKQSQINSKLRDLWKNLPESKKKQYTKKILTPSKKKKIPKESNGENHNSIPSLPCLDNDVLSPSTKCSGWLDNTSPNTASTCTSTSQNSDSDFNKLSSWKTYNKQCRETLNNKQLKDALQQQGILKTPNKQNEVGNERQHDLKVNFKIKGDKVENQFDGAIRNETTTDNDSDESDIDFVSGDMVYQAGEDGENTEVSNKKEVLTETTGSQKKSDSQDMCMSSCHDSGNMEWDTTEQTPNLDKSVTQGLSYKTPEMEPDVISDSKSNLEQAPRKKKAAIPENIDHHKDANKTNPRKKQHSNIISGSKPAHVNLENFGFKRYGKHVMDAAGDRCMSDDCLAENTDTVDCGPLDMESDDYKPVKRSNQLELDSCFEKMRAAASTIPASKNLELFEDQDVEDFLDSPKLLSPTVSGISVLSSQGDSTHSMKTDEERNEEKTDVHHFQDNVKKINMVQKENGSTEGDLCLMFQDRNPKKYKIKKARKRTLESSSLNVSEVYGDDELFLN